MNITARLRDDHAELEQLANAFRAMLAAPVLPTGLELIEFRQIFTHHILAHLHREDLLLYPRLLESQHPYVSAMAEAFLKEMGGLLDAYRNWALRWTTERALTDWARFDNETRELLDALTRRIDSENNTLYPLVEGDIAQAA